MDQPSTLRPYILSRKYDHFFIIGSPFLAFLSIALLCEPRLTSGEFLHNPRTPQWLIVFSTLITHAHIFLVFFRSHLNRSVLERFPLRFTFVPLIMLGGMWTSPVMFGICAFVAIYWDEWHSLMQTFGFGRIYDAKLGNDPTIGRKMDMGLCFVLGLLPHVILLTYIPVEVRTKGLEEFLGLDTQDALQYGHYISALGFPLVCFGICYIMYYFLYFQRLIRKGYIYSRTKLYLFLSTGLSATLIASFYTVADAAYFGNIYHALQYFFIVSISEGPLLAKRFGVEKEKRPLGFPLLFMGIFMVLILIAAARLSSHEIGFLGAFWMMTSLMHFWYDGFIWSVRRQDV